MKQNRLQFFEKTLIMGACQDPYYAFSVFIVDALHLK